MNLEPENKKKVLELILQAEELKKIGNLSSANDKLNLIKSQILKNNINLDEELIYNNTSSEHSYMNKKIIILYKIKEYQQVFEICEEVKKNYPDEPRIDKLQGDCLKKQEKYEEALKAYKSGIKKIKQLDIQHELSSSLHNQVGVTYTLLDNHSKALKHFDKALKKSEQNNDINQQKTQQIQYQCNKAMVYYQQDQKDSSLETFNKVLSQINNQKQQQNEENVIQMGEKLEKLIGVMQNINKVKVEDVTIEKREKKLVQQAVLKMQSTKSPSDSIVKNGEALLNTKEKLQQIKQNFNLYDYYDGFLFTVTANYDVARMIYTEKIQIDNKNTLIEVALRVAGILSLETLKGILDVVSDVYAFVKEAQIKQWSNNLCAFTTLSSEFEAMCQDAIVNVIFQKKSSLENLKPENHILPNYVQQFVSFIKQTFHYIESKLFGERNKTPMQRLGAKNANDVTSKYLASGKIYNGQLPTRISDKDKAALLNKYFAEVLQNDIDNQNKILIVNKDEAQNKKKQNCCEIFAQYSILYQNQLLNHKQLRRYCEQQIGLEKVLGYGQFVNPNLIQEALETNNYDIVLAALLSLK